MTSFICLFCQAFSVMLVNICYDGDNCVKSLVDSVGLGESVLDEGEQVLSVPDQFIVVA